MTVPVRNISLKQSCMFPALSVQNDTDYGKYQRYCAERDKSYIKDDLCRSACAAVSYGAEHFGV